MGAIPRDGGGRPQSPSIGKKITSVRRRRGVGALCGSLEQTFGQEKKSSCCTEWGPKRPGRLSGKRGMGLSEDRGGSAACLP